MLKCYVFKKKKIIQLILIQIINNSKINYLINIFIIN